MVNPYRDRHAHQHEWALEPSVEVDEDVWVRFPCDYWEGETYTDHERDETYTATHYECEARKVLVYELQFEVAGRDPMGESVEILEGVSPREADTLVEAPRRAVEHVYTQCEEKLREAFTLLDPENPMKGFGKDIEGVRVTAELRNDYVEEA